MLNIITVDMLAEMFGVSYSKALRDLKKSGVAWKIGRRWFLYEGYLREYFARLEGGNRYQESGNCYRECGDLILY